MTNQSLFAFPAANDAIRELIKTQIETAKQESQK